MFLKRLISLFFVFVLLLSDSGLKLFAHTCLKSKHTHYSLVAEKHCCGEGSRQQHCVVKKDSCCEVKSTYLKCNFVFEESKEESGDCPMAILPEIRPLWIAESVSPCSPSPAYNLPPPLSKHSFRYTSVIRC